MPGLPPAPPTARRPRDAVSLLEGLARVAWCVAALSGCEKSPAAPSHAGFDAAAVESALAALDSVIDAPTMASLTALSQRLIVAAAPAAAPPDRLSLACSAPARVTVDDHLAGLQATALIADSLFRHVVAYDTAARGYRVSADTSGPAGGMRFVLYQVNSYALPATPLSPDGWLDLVDRSAGGLLQLQAQISNGSTAIADYLVGLAGTQAADTALLSGTVTDRARTLALRDSTAKAPVAGTVAVKVAVSAHLTDSLDGSRLDMLASRTSFDPFDYDDTLDFTVTSATQTIRLAGAITTYCLLPTFNLTVAVNGAAYATITGGGPADVGGGAANVMLVGGQSAPADEAQAVLDMKAGQRAFFVWLGALVAPAQALLP